MSNYFFKVGAAYTLPSQQSCFGVPLKSQHRCNFLALHARGSLWSQIQHSQSFIELISVYLEKTFFSVSVFTLASEPVNYLDYDSPAIPRPGAIWRAIPHRKALPPPAMSIPPPYNATPRVLSPLYNNRRQHPCQSLLR